MVRVYNPVFDSAKLLIMKTVSNVSQVSQLAKKYTAQKIFWQKLSQISERQKLEIN